MRIDSPPLHSAAVCPFCRASKLVVHPQREAYADHAWCFGCGRWTSDLEPVRLARVAEQHQKRRVA